MRFTDFASFVHQYADMWGREIYRIPDPSQGEVILDCGVNIGLSAVYLAKMYPECQVLGWEPDERLSYIAGANIRSLGLPNVTVYTSAVWIDNRGVSFAPDDADAGSIVIDSQKRIDVQSVRLADIMAPYDRIAFLKMDIEGAEFAVIEDIADQLDKVQSAFVEVHLNSASIFRLPNLFDLLAKAGFTLRVEAVGSLGTTPLLCTPTENAFDSQLNVYCTRQTS